MKIEELRLGNRVMYHGKEYAVNGIHTNGTLSLERFGRGLATTLDIDEVLPVELSYELLEDIGFEKLDHPMHSEFRMMIDKYTTLYIQDDFSFGLDNDEEDCGLSFEMDIIGGLHRLQNIYFDLTGRELRV